MYVCVCVCVYIYIYIYIYTFKSHRDRDKDTLWNTFLQKIVTLIIAVIFYFFQYNIAIQPTLNFV